MTKFATFIYIVAAPTLAGIGAVIALVLGLSTKMLIACIVIGFVVALPVSFIIGKKVRELTKSQA